MNMHLAKVLCIAGWITGSRRCERLKDQRLVSGMDKAEGELRMRLITQSNDSTRLYLDQSSQVTS